MMEGRSRMRQTVAQGFVTCCLVVTIIAAANAQVWIKMKLKCVYKSNTRKIIIVFLQSHMTKYLLHCDFEIFLSSGINEMK